MHSVWLCAYVEDVDWTVDVNSVALPHRCKLKFSCVKPTAPQVQDWRSAGELPSLRLALWGASRLLHLFICACLLYTQCRGYSVRKRKHCFACQQNNELDYFRCVCTRRRWLLSYLLAFPLGFLHCSHVLFCERGKSRGCRFLIVTHEIHCHWLHMHFFLTASWERLHASLHKEGGGVV